MAKILFNSKVEKDKIVSTQSKSEKVEKNADIKDQEVLKINTKLSFVDKTTKSKPTFVDKSVKSKPIEKPIEKTKLSFVDKSKKNLSTRNLKPIEKKVVEKPKPTPKPIEKVEVPKPTPKPIEKVEVPKPTPKPIKKVEVPKPIEKKVIDVPKSIEKVEVPKITSTPKPIEKKVINVPKPIEKITTCPFKEGDLIKLKDEIFLVNKNPNGDFYIQTDVILKMKKLSPDNWGIFHKI